MRIAEKPSNGIIVERNIICFDQTNAHSYKYDGMIYFFVFYSNNLNF